MARLDIADIHIVARSEGNGSGDLMFALGMMYAVGSEVDADLVSAHKWFNIAAMRGNQEAARLRREIAAEMSDAQIGAAQRAARDWLKTQADTTEQPAEVRAAA